MARAAKIRAHFADGATLLLEPGEEAVREALRRDGIRALTWSRSGREFSFVGPALESLEYAVIQSRGRNKGGELFSFVLESGKRLGLLFHAKTDAIKAEFKGAP